MTYVVNSYGILRLGMNRLITNFNYFHEMITIVEVGQL